GHHEGGDADDPPPEDQAGDPPGADPRLGVRAKHAGGRGSSPGPRPFSPRRLRAARVPGFERAGRPAASPVPSQSPTSTAMTVVRPQVTERGRSMVQTRA